MESNHFIIDTDGLQRKAVSSSGAKTGRFRELSVAGLSMAGRVGNEKANTIVRGWGQKAGM